MPAKAETERIVLLDDNFQAIGTAPKLASHHARTPLHRAFSCYVFDDKGRLLVTQRAKVKKVWPGVWTNTLCGHPGPGESYEAAIKRRAREELGMELTEITMIMPKYAYRTPEFEGVVEFEFCPVHLAKLKTGPHPNPSEIEDYAWMSWQDYQDDMAAKPDKYSYWAKDQLLRLRHLPHVSRLNLTQKP